MKVALKPTLLMNGLTTGKGMQGEYKYNSIKLYLLTKWTYFIILACKEHCVYLGNFLFYLYLFLSLDKIIGIFGLSV